MRKKNNKKEKKWNETIEFLNNLVCNKELSFTKEGYLYLIELIKCRQNKKVLQKNQYLEDIRKLNESISQRLTSDMLGMDYVYKSTNDITMILLIPMYQRILFGYDYTDNYEGQLTSFFTKFWCDIINDNLFSGYNRTDRLISYIEACGIFDDSVLYDKKSVPEWICCPYFITIFVLQLIVLANDYSSARLEIFKHFVDLESTEHQILAFILQYIAFKIITTINYVASKNGENIYLYGSNNYAHNYKKFVEEFNKLEWTNFKFENDVKFNKDLRKNIDKVVLSFSVNVDNECEDADVTIATMIVGDNLDNSDDIINNQIDKLWEGILIV